MIRRFLYASCFALAVAFACMTWFFKIKVDESGALLDSFIAESLKGVPRQDVDAVAMALSRATYARTNHAIDRAHMPIYDRWEATSYFNVTTGTSLRLGIFGVEEHSEFGPCGTMSRVLMNALWRLKIPARKLHLPGGSGFVDHTMVEYRSGDRWVVISPSDSSFVWHDRQGRLASLDEIQSDSTITAQVLTVRPHWPATFQNARHIRWKKLPAPVRSAFRLVLGPARYEAFQTPRIYDQPRHLFRLVSLSASLVFALLALLLRPDRVTPAPAMPLQSRELPGPSLPKTRSQRSLLAEHTIRPEGASRRRK